MFKICLALAMFSSFAFAEPVSTSVQAKESATSTPSTWMATATSLITDSVTVGTGVGGGTPYSFRDAQVSNDTLALQYQTPWTWAGVVRAQYLNKYWLEEVHGTEQDQRSHGMGDTFVGASYPLTSGDSLHFVIDAGMFAPTGNYDQYNPYSPGHHYSYRMQLGSGTYDGSLAATALYSPAYYTLGGKLSSIIRTGQNHDDYRLGNQYRADAWADLPLKYGLTPRLVGYYRFISTASGNDNTVTLASTEYYLSSQVDWRVAAALKYQQTFMNSVTLGVEGGVPLAQYTLNADHLYMYTRYYGQLTMSGQF